MARTDTKPSARIIVVALLVALVLVLLLLALFWRSAWWPERALDDVGGYTWLNRSASDVRTVG